MALLAVSYLPSLLLLYLGPTGTAIDIGAWCMPSILGSANLFATTCLFTAKAIIYPFVVLVTIDLLLYFAAHFGRMAAYAILSSIATARRAKANIATGDSATHLFAPDSPGIQATSSDDLPELSPSTTITSLFDSSLPCSPLSFRRPLPSNLEVMLPSPPNEPLFMLQDEGKSSECPSPALTTASSTPSSDGSPLVLRATVVILRPAPASPSGMVSPRSVYTSTPDELAVDEDVTAFLLETVSWKLQAFLDRQAAILKSVTQDAPPNYDQICSVDMSRSQSEEGHQRDVSRARVAAMKRSRSQIL